MARNIRKFYVEWWSIKRSSVYGLVGLLAVTTVLVGSVWWLWQNNWVVATPEGPNTPNDSAVIISFEGTVQIIRVLTRVKTTVTKATYVQAGDTVQTQANGRAQIRMIDGSVLSVRPNSTVVISDSTSFSGDTSVKVELGGGQIKLKTKNQPESSNNVVEVQESQTTVLGQTEASFAINPKTNQGEIRVIRGGVESNVGGSKVVVSGNEYVAINENKISSREALLNAPNLSQPSPSKQIFAKGSNANVAFSWRTPREHQGLTYDFQIAQSPFFVSGKMIVEKEALYRSGFFARSLAPGTYFWRVRASIKSGQISDWSDPSKFSVIRHTNSSGIEVSDWAVENVGGNIYMVSGFTKSGATVRILNRKMFAKSDGSFNIQISSEARAVVVGISDQKGNRSRYTISLVTGKALR